MAELANPLCWAARAIGFDAFGWLTTLFERARVVLVWLFCVAQPPSVCILRCIIWSHHKLMDRTDHMRLVQVLLRKAVRHRRHAACRPASPCRQPWLIVMFSSPPCSILMVPVVGSVTHDPIKACRRMELSWAAFAITVAHRRHIHHRCRRCRRCRRRRHRSSLSSPLLGAALIKN